MLGTSGIAQAIVVFGAIALSAYSQMQGPTASMPPLAHHDVDPLFAPACSTPLVVAISEASDPRGAVVELRASAEARTELHRVGEQVMGKRIELIGYNPIERSPAVWLSSQESLCQALLTPHASDAAKADSATHIR